MAHRKNLSVPFFGMPFIWNVDNKVGTQTSETNEKDDVALVQLLISLATRKTKMVDPGCDVKPRITGEMDPVTGFWIYYIQVEGRAQTQVDGYISPVRGQNVRPFILALINAQAFKVAKEEWQDLPNHMLCPPSLKAKLLAPPRNI